MQVFSLTPIVLAAILALASVPGQAADLTYQVPIKGLLRTNPGGTPGNPGPTLPTSPPADEAVPPSLSVRFLKAGVPVSEVQLYAGREVVLEIQNMSASPVAGYLGYSDFQYVYADMTRSTCNQTAATPLQLAPGASCSFVLVEPSDHRYARPTDYLAFKSVFGDRIPNVLTLPTTLDVSDPTPGNTNPTPGNTNPVPGEPTSDGPDVSPAVSFLKNGTVISSLYSRPGLETILTIQNVSPVALTGSIGDSDRGYAWADLSRGSCATLRQSTSQLTLAPGASCSFVLVEPSDHSLSRPDDAISLWSNGTQRIPSALSLPGAITTIPGGGDRPPTAPSDPTLQPMPST